MLIEKYTILYNWQYAHSSIGRRLDNEKRRKKIVEFPVNLAHDLLS